MLTKPLFWETFFLLALVGFLNFVAGKYHLYWSITEFDSLMHFLGGAFVSIFFLWLYFFSGFFSSAKRSITQFLLVSFFGVLFIATIWEIYELILGEAKFARTSYAFDTTLDFIMDFLGALAACMYGYLKKIKYESETLWQ